MLSYITILLYSYIITFIFVSIGKNIDNDNIWYPKIFFKFNIDRFEKSFILHISVIVIIIPILNLIVTLITLIEIFQHYKKLF